VRVCARVCIRSRKYICIFMYIHVLYIYMYSMPRHECVYICMCTWRYKYAYTLHLDVCVWKTKRETVRACTCVYLYTFITGFCSLSPLHSLTHPPPQTHTCTQYLKTCVQTHAHHSVRPNCFGSLSLHPAFHLVYHPFKIVSFSASNRSFSCKIACASISAFAFPAASSLKRLW